MATHLADVESQKASGIETKTRSSEEAHQPGGIFRPVDPGTRLPIEYRTVSIHVETSTPSGQGQTAEKRKVAVKGVVQRYLLLQCHTNDCTKRYLHWNGTRFRPRKLYHDCLFLLRQAWRRPRLNDASKPTGKMYFLPRDPTFSVR